MREAARVQAELSVANSYWWMNERETALKFSRAAVVTATSIGDLRERARALNNLGLMLSSSRNAEVETIFAPLREAVQKTGSWRYSQISHWIPAGYYALKGDAEAAESARQLYLELHLVNESERSNFLSLQRHSINLGNLLNENYRDIISGHLRIGPVAEQDLQYCLIVDTAVAYLLVGDVSKSDDLLKEARNVFDRLSALQAYEVMESVLLEVTCLGASGRWQRARKIADQTQTAVPTMALAERLLRTFCDGPPFDEVTDLLNLCENEPYIGLWAVVLRRIIKNLSPDRVFSLTPAELDVLRLLKTGRSNKEIGESRNRSPETIKRQVASLFKKLGVENRMTALEVARRHGLI